MSARRSRAAQSAVAGIACSLPALAWPAACAGGAGDARSTVIVNAVVLDGSGAPPRRASVRIVGDRIAEVGHLEASPRDSRVDADGLSLAPGFIDTHSHADADLAEHPAALVYEDGRTTGRRPGRVIRRPPSAKGS